MRRFFSLSDLKSKSSPKEKPNPVKSFSFFKRQKSSKPTQPTSPTRLPIELYRLILAFLPQDTKLYPLLFINSVFSSEVTCVLYSNISLVEDILGYTSSRTAERHIRLFELLGRTERISRLVHSFAVPPHAGLCPYETEELYWKTLNSALRAMPNLKEFAYGKAGHLISGLPFQMFEAILNGCTFRLRRLAILSPAVMDQEVKILESDVISEQLEELSILWSLDAEFDVQHAFPRLAVLEMLDSSPVGSLPQLMAPPRTIRALSILAPTISQPRTYPELLSLRIGPWDSFDWSRLATAFPSLRFLSTYNPAVDQVGYEKADFAFLTNMTTHHIPALVHLRKVAFNGDTMRLHKISQPRRQFASHLLSYIPHLESVCIGMEEWDRIQLGQGRPRVYTRLDEWKDRQWWDST